MKNIVLIGLMGAGKSSVGKYLSDKIGYDFLDTDNFIENEQNMKISDIFEKFGEKYFRELESKLAIILSTYKNTVISTGGGFVQNIDNITNISKNSLIIYLQSSPESLYNRIKTDNTRPLLQNNNPLEKLQELLQNREKNYKLANLIINTENKSVEDVANEILKEYYANN